MCYCSVINVFIIVGILHEFKKTISIYRHPRYTATNCGEQTVALCGDLTVFSCCSVSALPVGTSTK
jgi:hypothetical protein